MILVTYSRDRKIVDAELYEDIESAADSVIGYNHAQLGKAEAEILDDNALIKAMFLIREVCRKNIRKYCKECPMDNCSRCKVENFPYEWRLP